jgi:hypothetical protein
MALGSKKTRAEDRQMTPPTLTLDRGTAAPITTEVTSPARHHAPARELFVVATHKVRDRSGGTPNSWLPYGTEHAWEPGTRRTLCGEWITGWTVFWDRHFSARPTAACAACVEATLPEASRLRLDHFDQGRTA